MARENNKHFVIENYEKIGRVEFAETFGIDLISDKDLIILKAGHFYRLQVYNSSFSKIIVFDIL